ncbi:hypothetical protein K2Q08_01695 [Patescibacteria group bacterium]|nr:hypothetical protein [Patescibacteria group bacterium]
MNNHGLSLGTTILVIIGVVIMGALAYLAFRPQTPQAPVAQTTATTTQSAPGDHPEVEHGANDGVSGERDIAISWRFTNAGDVKTTPYTAVTVVINGTAHDMGKFAGSCSELGANGGIDGKGQLAGELSAAQCWFAGGGNEIGVFAHEDGGVDIMVGELGEGADGAGMFRGNFKIKSSIKL